MTDSRADAAVLNGARTLSEPRRRGNIGINLVSLVGQTARIRTAEAVGEIETR
jgi:hypothetical protein